MRKKIFSLSYSLCFLSIINAQTIDKTLNDYFSGHPFERVYLHLDNNLYSADDTVWFKGYLTANGFVSSYSKNLYVDWFDATGKLLQHQAYPIVQGATYGQFAIPQTIEGNQIEVLAYTRWMLNDDTAYLFHKTIPVLSAKASLPIQKTEPQKILLQFFPEGGNLVAGVQNKVAFKATDQFGNPIELNGTIKDNHNDSVTSFITIHDGMGTFYLTPKATTTYVAEYDSTKPTVNLPEAQSWGVNMQVLLEQDKRKIIIQKHNTEQLSQVYLLATMNGIVDYLAKIDLSTRDSAVSIIPTNDLPSGIITFTVLDKDWHPLTERISFVRGNDIDSHLPNLSIEKTSTEKKGLNSITLNYDDSIATDLSIAVTDADIPNDSTENIITYLLLTGQLKGKIINPAYYFEDTTSTRQQQLDLVMLTNGWRKYNWHEIAQGTQPAIKYPRDSNYFFLRGNIADKKKHYPDSLSFILNDRIGFGKYNVKTNKDGSFADSTMIIADTTKLAYHPGKQSHLTLNFEQLPQAAFNEYPFELFKANGHATIRVSQWLNHYYGDTSGKMLTTVTVTATRKTTMDSIEDIYASSVFKNAPGYRVVLENNPILYSYGGPRSSIIDLLRGRVPRLNDSKVSPPYVFVDESLIPIDVVNNTISYPDIAFIKYFPDYFVLAPGGGGVTTDTKLPRGVIAIYTKKFSQAEKGENDTKQRNIIIGYTISKKFYEPAYNTENDSITDKRKTLYWNPQMGMDDKDNKKVKISFYNNDYSKKFRVIIEGLKADGTPVYVEKIIE
ncbi:MAG: hypothetical protein PW786_10515 [Arachidicoccus sp.]|nr:hypothetical protein [Arachidicoccus sp.]